MKMRAKISTLAVALLFALPGTASAAGTQIAPDFDDAYAYGDCSTIVFAVPSVPGTCSSSVNAQVDGTLDLDLEVSTPLKGRLPGPSGTGANLSLSLDRAVPEGAARVFIYTVTLHIEDASATSDARPLSSGGYGSIYLGAYLSLDEGGRYDDDWESRDLVDLGGRWAPSSIHDQDVIMTLVVGDGESRVHTGRVNLYVDVYADASAGGISLDAGIPRGSVKVSLDAAVTSVTVEPIA